MRQILLLLSSKLMIEPDLQNKRLFVVKTTMKIDKEKYLLFIDSVLKINHWTYKMKDLNGKK